MALGVVEGMCMQTQWRLLIEPYRYLCIACAQTCCNRCLIYLSNPKKHDGFIELWGRHWRPMK